MIKAIIFDCFGVLTSEGWLPLCDEYFGANPVQLGLANDTMKQLDAGLIGYKEFANRIAGLAETTPEVVLRRLDDNVPDAALFAYIARKLRPRYKLGLLSNAGQDWLSEIFASEQISLFDVICLSFVTGYVKPDEYAFTDIAAKLEVDAEECIFVDDQPRYVEGAERVGMRGVLYQGFGQFKRDLEALLP